MIPIGVLLTTALVLAIAAAFIEFRLFYTVPILKKLVEKSAAIGIGMSLLLSLLIGTMFGAAGLVVMVAGMLSTAFTEPVHAMNRKMQKNAQNSAKVAGRMTINDFRDTYRPVAKVIKFGFIVMTLPIWLPVKIKKMASS